MNIVFEKKVTLGQIFTTILFLLGMAVAWGSTKTTVSENEKKIAFFETSQKDFVRKTELESELRGMRGELSTIKLILFSSITGKQLSSTDVHRIESEIAKADSIK